MKSTYTRLRSRRPATREAAMFNKENKQEQAFFGEAAHEPFFKPSVAMPQANVQRKCADCEGDEKVQRVPEKKEEEKVQRMAEKKEEKVQHMPEKKEEEKVQRVSDKKKEEKVQRAPEKKEEEKVQKKEAAATNAAPANTAGNYIKSINGKGQPLSPGLQSFYGNRMGADFSDVKIHTGKESAESAGDIHAQAYAYGNHIVFGEGKYQPESGEGKHLLAHELTHVLQQGSRSVSKKIIQRKLKDGHDLASPRFAGDLVLEGCYDNERTLRVGSKGGAVIKLQQALVDAGFPLPKFGVDGDFGNETETAVRDFQQKAVILIDGIVGPQTMGALDTQFGAPAPPPPVPAPVPVPSTITYSAPSERREDPIPKVLSSTSNLLGETLPKFNGTITRTRQQAENILGPIFVDNIPLVYDPQLKVCKIDVSQIQLDVSADVQKLTVPSGKWSGIYSGSMVKNCGQNSTVNVEMDSPSGAAAFEQRIAADEQEHVDDLNRIAKNHFDAFYTYLAGISLPSTTGNDCAALYTAEIGTKDVDMIVAFLNDWQAAVALHDNAAGNHHHSTVTDNRNCNLVKITARN